MEDIYFEQQSEALTIDDIFDIQQNKRINASSYGFLALVYDFIYQRYWDYEGGSSRSLHHLPMGTTL